MQYYKVQGYMPKNARTIKYVNQLHLQMEQHISVFLQKQDKTIETTGIRNN